MRTIFNKDTGDKTWGLETWYEKTIYVIGYACTLFIVASFLVGFISGVLESI